MREAPSGEVRDHRLAVLDAILEKAAKKGIETIRAGVQIEPIGLLSAYMGHRRTGGKRKPVTVIS